jgi:hypothetical protein
VPPEKTARGPAFEEVDCWTERAGLVEEAVTPRMPQGEVVPMPSVRETRRFEVEAVPETLMAVVDAYGKTEAVEEVAMKKLAVGDEVAPKDPAPVQ